ncbi:hypothetical protein HRI_000269400 [Hibiscus trionum]|uniref:Uncharacterized protein n=1 Tax=Hibiscus trionum TaxID=183268 RepID=A0A9W7GW97_HIBTR|nr:hypothetical protein HRI_000269400 [Hibiscus trionum]
MATSSSPLEPPASIFSSSSIKAPPRLRKSYPFLLHIKQRHPQREINFVSKYVVKGVSVLDSSLPPPVQDVKSEFSTILKLKLLNIVFGLNRGLSANEDNLWKADVAAKEFETVVEPVNLSADLYVVNNVVDIGNGFFIIL